MSRFLLSGILVAVGVSGLLAQDARPAFEVASVRKQLQSGPVPPTGTSPDTFYRRSETLAFLVRLAYDLQSFQIVGGPDWIRTDRFEIHAKAAGAASTQQMHLMLQTLLEERFKLSLRRELREMSHFVLTLDGSEGRLGPTLWRCGESSAVRKPRPAPNPRLGYLVRGTCASLLEIETIGTASMGAPVVDATGVTGLWTYELLYARPPGSISVPEQDRRDRVYGELPAFDVAVREQLGMKLERRWGPVEVFVIESVQQPTEN